MDFDDIARAASQSGHEIAELKTRLRQLQTRLDRHGLVIQVLRDMLMAANPAAEVEFYERLKKVAIDAAESNTCTKCGKMLNSKHNRCLYCGEPRSAEIL